MTTVKGFSSYKVTADGKVYNKHGKLMSTYISKLGYERVNLVNNSGQRQCVTVHRLVALAYIPKIVDKLIVNHINGNKADNRVSNLEWCTYQENTAHAQRTGLMAVAKPKVKSNYDPSNKVQCSNGMTFKSYKEVVDKGYATSRRGIYAVVSGEQKTHNGYQWSRA